MDHHSDLKKKVNWQNFAEYCRFMKDAARDARRICDFQAPPYDPYTVAEKFGVDVQHAPLQGVDGYVQQIDGRWRATISTSSPLERQRFTLSHELGHYVLMKAAERGYARDLMRYRVAGFSPELHQDPVEERLCNVYAAELLLPHADISKRINWGLNVPRDIPSLAGEFRVSLHAAARGVIKILGERNRSLSLWKLDSPWPMNLWWVGIKKVLHRDRSKIQDLVARTKYKETDLSAQWSSLSKKRDSVRIRVSSTAGGRFAFLFLERLVENRVEELPGWWRV